jgi:hypothetical protein
MTGIAANESIRTGQLIMVNDLFPLPPKSPIPAPATEVG